MENIDGAGPEPYMTGRPEPVRILKMINVSKGNGNLQQKEKEENMHLYF
jgi:hypothetical protein